MILQPQLLYSVIKSYLQKRVCSQRLFFKFLAKNECFINLFVVNEKFTLLLNLYLSVWGSNWQCKNKYRKDKLQQYFY